MLQNRTQIPVILMIWYVSTAVSGWHVSVALRGAPIGAAFLVTFYLLAGGGAVAVAQLITDRSFQKKVLNAGIHQSTLVSALVHWIGTYAMCVANLNLSATLFRVVKCSELVIVLMLSCLFLGTVCDKIKVLKALFVLIGVAIICLKSSLSDSSFEGIPFAFLSACCSPVRDLMWYKYDDGLSASQRFGLVSLIGALPALVFYLATTTKALLTSAPYQIILVATIAHVVYNIASYSYLKISERQNSTAHICKQLLLIVIFYILHQQRPSVLEYMGLTLLFFGLSMFDSHKMTPRQQNMMASVCIMLVFFIFGALSTSELLEAMAPRDRAMSAAWNYSHNSAFRFSPLTGMATKQTYPLLHIQSLARPKPRWSLSSPQAKANEEQEAQQHWQQVKSTDGWKAAELEADSENDWQPGSVKANSEDHWQPTNSDSADDGQQVTGNRPPVKVQDALVSESTHLACFAAIRRNFAQSLRDIFDDPYLQAKPLVLMDPAEHFNVGDTLITRGEEAFVAAFGWNTSQSIETCRLTQAFHGPDCRQHVSKTTTARLALWSAGGNWGNLYQNLQPKRVQSFHYLLAKNITVVGMPQSIYYLSRNRNASEQADARAIDAAVRTNTRRGAPRPRVVLLWRQRDSYDTACRLYPFVDNRLVPDIAFGAGPYFPRLITADSADILHREVAKLRTTSSNYTRSFVDILMLLRLDKEGLIPAAQRTDKSVRAALDALPGGRGRNVTFRTTDWKEVIAQYRFRELTKNTVDRRIASGVAALSTGRVVIADRLHAVILALLTLRPVVALEQSYGKVRSTLEVALAAGGEEACGGVRDEELGRRLGVYWARNLSQAIDIATMLVARCDREGSC